jgi:hypothetical protein
MLFTSERLGGPISSDQSLINPLNAKLNPICHLLALLGAHHILHVSRIRVNSNTGMEMLEVAEKNLLDNKAEVTTYFINDENTKNCPHIDIKIWNRNVKRVIDTGSEISLIYCRKY